MKLLFLLLSCVAACVAAFGQTNIINVGAGSLGGSSNAIVRFNLDGNAEFYAWTTGQAVEDDIGGSVDRYLCFGQQMNTPLVKINGNAFYVGSMAIRPTGKKLIFANLDSEVDGVAHLFESDYGEVLFNVTQIHNNGGVINSSIGNLITNNTALTNVFLIGTNQIAYNIRYNPINADVAGSNITVTLHPLAPMGTEQIFENFGSSYFACVKSGTNKVVALRKGYTQSAVLLKIETNQWTVISAR